MLLRVRTRNGVSQVEAGDDWTRDELLKSISELSGIDVDRIKIKSGFPPTEVTFEDVKSVKSIFRQGDSLVVEETSKTESVGDSVVAKDGRTHPMDQESEPSPVAPAPSRAARGSSIADEADFVRRVVPDDNSCLFRAVSLIIGQRHTAALLRRTVANGVRDQPHFYTEVTLGKSNQEYQSWIQRETSWGGAIELSILADHFKTEIAAIDVKTTRMDCYGEGKNYELRGYLLYDGIHYDAIALALGGESNQDLDVTLFASNDAIAQTKAIALAQRENKRKAYTDTANFKLKCQDCGAVVYGEKGALGHTKTTAHSNYAEG
uniref:Ubiquitin thioesterase OTU n=1 Tax=Rhodosorus marinus TaxID=101924 RepID=A0A7S3A134_9RHOD|mmetsp:Transcript_40734/g.161464  ORF Transcript_40734/g.161464 Transcript_40734/m.161464 type:complete len:320 (+) Transcript_40734:170-1129(+)